MKLLLAEDEADLRQVLAHYLSEKLHAEVLQAVSGNEAIALIERHSDIDCVICDYDMADGNGGEVFTFLQATRPSVPYILCSCDYPDEYQEFRGKKLAGCIRKPFEARVFVDTVGQVMQVPRGKA